MQGEKADACIKFFVSIQTFHLPKSVSPLGNEVPRQSCSYVIGRLSCAQSLVASLVGEHVLRPWCWRVLPRALMDDQTKVCSQSRHVVGVTEDMIVSVLPFRFGL